MLSLDISQLVFFIVISIWELIWKGIALWKCGQKKKVAWFVILLIVNSVGILPLIYLLFFDSEEKKKGIRKNKK